ncbi:MAG TPA: hypothetical protein VNQ50_07360 [Xanthobacteraceae bacterium]|jgi:hypothetical protein|nr:hypothetical protein [Xanthobacteraceae bacterium]
MATDIAANWGDLVERVVALGAPILGGALGGPLGAAAGQILAEALGAADATPAAVNDALAAQAADPAAAIAAARQAERDWLAALAEIGKTQVAEVGATQRAEAASGDPLQRWWRPLYALELSLLECPAFALTMLHALWVGHEAGINGFANLSALLMTYFGARFGVLGVYVTGRTREKCGGAEPPSSLLGGLLQAAVKKK